MAEELSFTLPGGYGHLRRPRGKTDKLRLWQTGLPAKMPPRSVRSPGGRTDSFAWSLFEEKEFAGIVLPAVVRFATVSGAAVGSVAQREVVRSA